MKRPLTAPALAALLLAESIARYERDPALRAAKGIDLKQLAEVGKIRRKIMKKR